ncbi:MAG TPA: hypothetical protein VJ770_13670 [Stellaceae bacterium]|nr:hypothetical protein [Stellaceae bacterium]
MPDPVSGHGAGLPEARISHATPNRIRLKVPARRHDAAFFRTVENRLTGWRHVERVEVNPTTASILVHFSDPVALMHEAMTGNDLFQIIYPQEGGDPSSRPLLSRVQEAAATADGSLRHWTGGSLDLRTAVFAILLVSGLQQLALGNVAAPAATLLWYAATVLGLPGTPQPSHGKPEAV